MIWVLGGGAFGTALALAISRRHATGLWMRDAELAEQAAKTRLTTGRLPGINLPEGLNVSADLGAVRDAKAILLAVPTQALGGFLAEHAATLPAVPLVACCKGIDLQNGLGPTRVIKTALPDAATAILTGPSFAADIARGLPTALTLAAETEALADDLQAAISTPALRLYRTTDVTGAELGGALKNVIAIACGAVIGAGLGDSARAALMTRGFAELQRFALLRGADPATLQGLSGLGDLTLTCTSDHSRNYRYGFALGAGRDFDAGLTVEGVATARALRRIARDAGLDLPVCFAVAALVAGRLDVHSAMDLLLNRPLRAE